MDRFSHRLHSRILLSVLLCASFACKPQSKDEVKRKLNDAIEGIKGQTGDPMEEIEKLHQLEYSVRRFPINASAVELESALDKLGKARWDCFHIERSIRIDDEGKRSMELLVFCKRLPETFLRYIPRNLIGR